MTCAHCRTPRAGADGWTHYAIPAHPALAACPRHYLQVTLIAATLADARRQAAITREIRRRTERYYRGVRLLPQLIPDFSGAARHL